MLGQVKQGSQPAGAAADASTGLAVPDLPLRSGKSLCSLGRVWVGGRMSRVGTGASVVLDLGKEAFSAWDCVMVNDSASIWAGSGARARRNRSSNRARAVISCQ
jgi:hypothetical protein